MDSSASTKYVDQCDIDDFVLTQKAANTTKKEKSDYNRLKFFFLKIKETREIQDIPDKQLDNILCQFFMTAVNLKGNLYEPDTLTGFVNSFQRILSSRGSQSDLKRGLSFANCRKVLGSRRKQLRKLGKGNKPNATRALETEEINKLFERGYFGIEDPISLQRTIWWHITTRFGHRARDEARQMSLGDIKLDTDPQTGEEFLVWDTERSTKTRTGERPMGAERRFNPKAYATGCNRCPVSAWKVFLSKRPLDMQKSESPLFLQPRYALGYREIPVWFYSKPMGKNGIGSFMRDASKILQDYRSAGKVSNHSARKTSISTLLNNNVDPLLVQQLSGHKKIESLASYHVASLQQQRQMSKILNFNSNVDSVKSSDLPHDVQDELMKPWNPVLPTSLPPMFSGANISNCVFNIYTGTPPKC